VRQVSSRTPPLQLQPDNLLVSSEGGRDNKAHSLTFGDTVVLSNTTINSFRTAFNYTDVHRTHQPLGFDATDVGIKTFSYLEDYMLLTVLNGGFQLGGGMESEAKFRTPSYQISDDLTIIKGSHQFGVGGSVAYWKSLSLANIRSPGQFTFDGTVTGLPLADFLTGSLAQLSQTVPNGLDMQQWYVGLYAQDTWKLSPRATMNYGVRWEPGLAQQIRDGAVYTFSTDRFLRGERSTQFTNAPPGFLYPGDSGFANGKAGRDDHWWQFSPRVGFAWDPKGDGRMAIRFGYSLSYDFVNGQAHLSTSVAPPFGADARVNLPVGGFDNPWLGTGNETFFPFQLRADSPFPLTGTYVAIPPDIKPPRQQSWNVGVQRQIGENLAASATYLGSYSDRLWNIRSLNPGVFIPGSCTLQTLTGAVFYPVCSTNANLNNRRALTLQNYETGKFLGVVDEHTAIGEQRYNGVLLSVQRRSANGVSVSANYTLSKCMGHPTQGGQMSMAGTGYVKPGDVDYDYGPCDTDRRHIFNLTGSVMTPDFSNAGLRAVASNWRVSGILRLASGRRLNVTVTTDPARTGIVNQRASLVGNNPYGDKSFNNYLNPAAFADPAVGTYGNLERNALVGPITKGADIAIVRAFPFAGTHRIEARVEAFNAFNWFSPATIAGAINNSPVVNRNSVQFGRITAADDPRIMQFAVKYSF
jgi:TonB dependent receptor-like, beta-barrel